MRHFVIVAALAGLVGSGGAQSDAPSAPKPNTATPKPKTGETARPNPGGKIRWRTDGQKTLATARACAEEACAWRPVILYFTVDW